MGKQDRSIRSSVRGLFEWMRQKIDWALNRGPIWIIGWLALAVFAVAFSSAVVVRLLHLTHDGSFGRVMWVTLIRTIDPGQIAEDKGGFAFLALGITLLGLLLFSSLISLTSGQFERRVEHVRRGRDEVRLKRQGKDEQPKQPYYVVLGWTDLTRKVVEELLFSGSGKHAPTVVVMSDTPWPEMDAVMHEWWRGVRSSSKSKNGGGSEAWRNRRQSPVQLRRGNPSDKRDLVKILKIDRATAVVVLNKDHPSDVLGAQFTTSQILAQLQDQTRKSLGAAPDSVFAAQVRNPDSQQGSHGVTAQAMQSETAETVKCILAVVAALEERESDADAAKKVEPEGVPPRIIAEFPRASGERVNLGSVLAERLKAVGVELVTAEAADLQAHIAAQVAFSPGLSAVFRDLVNFGGSEFYLRDCGKGLATKTFGDARSICSESRPVGLYSASGALPGGSRVLFCPPAKTPLAGHQLVILAEDKVATYESSFTANQEAAESSAALSNEDLWDGSADTMKSGSSETTLAAAPVNKYDEKVLILGWNARAAELLVSVRHMHPDAELTVVLPHWVERDDLLASYKDEHLKFEFAQEGIQTWVETYSAAPSGSHSRYHRVLLLADDTVDPEVADAEVLMSALAFRPSSNDLNPNSSVVEFRQRSSRYLTTGGVVDDHIIADSLLANLLAQYAVEPKMKLVLNTLLEVGGGRVELHAYVPSGKLVGRTDDDVIDPEDSLVDLGLPPNSLYLGYRKKSKSGVGLGELVLNPPRGSNAPRVKPSELSDLIVLVPDQA